MEVLRADAVELEVAVSGVALPRSDRDVPAGTDAEVREVLARQQDPPAIVDPSQLAHGGGIPIAAKKPVVAVSGMAKSAPSEDQLRKNFAAGVGAKGSKWLENFKSATGKVEAARSDAAESTYAAKVQAAVANRSRLKGLASVSESDLNAAADAVGAGGFTTPATAKAGKFAKKAKPYVDLAVSTANALPPRGADPEANVDARVKPIVRALHAKKMGGA
jgi:hypothetical protein